MTVNHVVIGSSPMYPANLFIMEKKEIIVTSDYKKIKSIKFKYPNLMASNAEDLVRKEYNEILELKNELSNARDKVRLLENSLKEKEKEFLNKQEWFSIEFETKTKEYITKESGLVHNGDLVYHYKP